VRLCSAGLDKNVQVWNVTAIRRDLRRVFLRERTIRWQVARGLRGSIYALASAPSDGLLALGGYGAMGSLGEILLVNPVDGTLVKVLEGTRPTQGHRQAVLSLAFSADGNSLAAMHADGECVLRQRDAWQPITLYGPDDATYGDPWAGRIGGLPKRRPVVVAGNRHVFLPVLKGKSGDRLTWKLQQIELADRTARRDHDDVVHQGMVTALAASFDGLRLASADLDGNLFLWDLSGDVQVERLRQGAVVASLSFSRDAKILAVGTAAAEGEKSELQVWDLDTRTLKKRLAVPDPVLQACAISPDGKRLADVSDDGKVTLRELELPELPKPEPEPAPRPAPAAGTQPATGPGAE
ncbi:hypothetical protein LCGC14_2797820, partial [marine sediment metagenome]